MKKLLIAVLCVLAVGCASFKARLPHLPNGDLDVQKLLSWAEDGVIADCAIQGVDAKVCSLGLPTLKALENKDAASIKSGLQAWVVQFPAAGVYVNWLINDLP